MTKTQYILRTMRLLANRNDANQIESLSERELALVTKAYEMGVKAPTARNWIIEDRQAV